MVEARALERLVASHLREHGITAAVEARTLLQTATGYTREQLLAGAAIDDEQEVAVWELTRRRVQGEPLQYLVGRWPFLDFELEVGPGVLIPRPETEQLVLLAADYLKERENPAFLDLCTGSGCIAIGMARLVPHSRGTAVDISPQALYYTRRNAASLCPLLTVVQADLFGYENEVPDGSLDAVVCNPPYVTEDEYRQNYEELRCEPKLALVAEGDALGYYRYLAANYHCKLKDSGKLFLECGSVAAQQTADIFRQAGWHEVMVMTDDFGLPRFITASRNSQIQACQSACDTV